jgi:hypothetical protein
MTMNNEKDIHDVDNTVKEPTDTSNEESTDGEFKVTVRKLELPVRPRGVLAE